MLSSVMVNCCANPYPQGHRVFRFLDNKRNGLLMSPQPEFGSATLEVSLRSMLLSEVCLLSDSLYVTAMALRFQNESTSTKTTPRNSLYRSLWNPSSHIILLHIERLGSLTCSLPLRRNSDLFVNMSYTIFGKTASLFSLKAEFIDIKTVVVSFPYCL